jgi:D-threo-aldose 1-dehydrogenase
VKATDRVTLGRTGLSITRLSLGGASIGGLYRPVADEDAVALVEHAWSIGIRSFDVAPLYGYGSAERRMGSVLAGHPRDEFVLSTKVGRLVRDPGEVRPAEEPDRQSDGHSDDAFYAGTGGRRIVFDFSADGVLRSVAASLDRLGLDRIDILYIHDPDDHWQAALDGAYPALERLRAEGVVSAIGVGMNQPAMLERFAAETDIDLVLLANRYTILDQSALDGLLPRCLERGIAVMAGGVMNSGVLLDRGSGGHFDYRPASPAVIERARRMAETCERHGVAVSAAAIQFPLAHPAVAGLIAGVRSPAHLDDYPAGLAQRIPPGLWAELRSAGLLPAEAPVPDQGWPGGQPSGSSSRR